MSNSPTTEVANEALVEHLRHHLGSRIRDLHIVIQDRGLVLNGRAATYYVKQLAQHAAMDATGLPILANDIEVW